MRRYEQRLMRYRKNTGRKRRSPFHAWGIVIGANLVLWSVFFGPVLWDRIGGGPFFSLLIGGVILFAVSVLVAFCVGVTRLIRLIGWG